MQDSNAHQKAVLIANRGLKAMSFANKPIATHIGRDYTLDNDEWKINNKLRLMKNIIPER